MTAKTAQLLALQNGILCGVAQYSDVDGKRHIHLFETAENKGNPVIADNLPAVCVSVLDRLQPLSSIEDVQWHFTNSPFHTDINFEPLGAGGYLMSLTSTKLGYESITPLSSYQKALNSPSGFERAITGAPCFNLGSEGRFVIVPVPHHPAGFYTLSDQHNYETLVLADAVKLRDHWVKQSLASHECDTLTQLATLYNRNAIFMSGDDNPIAPLHADTKTSIGFMKERVFMNSLEMPRMNFSESSSQLKFVNGRHRTINLINCGAPFIPALLSSSPQNVAAFKEKFEWTPQQHESAFLRTTLRAAPAKPRFG